MTTNKSQRPFISTAPGRLCLFGEHQDYLNLPVIALSLPLACTIHVTPDKDSRELILHMPAMGLNQEGVVWSIHLDRIPPKQGSVAVSGATLSEDEEPLDFALAAVHEMLKDGWVFDQGGAVCVSTTTLPLQAGVSSSSAFCVAWIQVLAKLMTNTTATTTTTATTASTLTPLQVAKLAHRAEVTHFGSPGGTMDHMTSALGGILRIGPGMWDYQRLQAPPQQGVWVLAFSGQPKDTIQHLNRCKGLRLKLLEKLGGSWDNTCVDELTEDERTLLKATITNRDTEQRAATEWSVSPACTLASYMGQHHAALRDGLHLSTPRLESMNEAAMKAGAWAFKVVGSGGGGCGVAWCFNGVADAVALAMKDAGAPETWIISDGSQGASIRDAES
jgi:galactokinase